MAKQGKSHETDIITDVFTKLCDGKSKEIKKEDAKNAKEKYNQIVADLTFYKKEHDKRYSDSVRSDQRYKANIRKLQGENASSRNQIQELERRLSSVMEPKIDPDNPEIVCINDQYRPTKLAEEFQSLYDEEWISAYEEIDETGNIKGEEALIGVLAEVVNEADGFCDNARNYQLECVLSLLKFDDTDMRQQTVDHSKFDQNPDRKIKKMLKEIQKECTDVSMGPLTKIFYEDQLKKLLLDKKLSVSSPKMDTFVAKLLHILWMMKVQDPPICLVWQHKGEQIYNEYFTYYSKRGDVVAFCVWPAVFLHMDGPLLSKGVLQAK